MLKFIIYTTHGVYPMMADNEQQAREISTERLAAMFPGETVQLTLVHQE